MKLFSLLLTTLPLMLLGQPVRFGVKGGFLLTEPTRYTPEQSRSFTVGPVVEFQLPNHFAIEAGFLYKRIGTGHDVTFTDYRSKSSSRGNSFEIPVIGKYYFRPPSRWTPYLGLGVAMRRTWQSTEGSLTGPATDQFRPGEFRYTRWSEEPQTIRRNPNQVEFLFGISF